MDEFQLLTSKIDEIAAFLDSYKNLINCHMVEFITGDFFERLIPADLKPELTSLTDQQLCQLPNARPNFLDASENPNLSSFLGQIEHLSLANLISDKIFDHSLQCAKDDEKETKISFNHFMGVKKSHEVERMGRFINDLARKEEINTVVDIGSGKGYLSSLLAMCFNLEVIGIDASDVNTESASKRHTNVSKHWPSIIKRLDLQKLDGGGKYTPLKRSIDHRGVNLEEISLSENRNVLICGLHTCGDLASNSMEIFLKNRRAKVLCLISCCYHLIEEEFFANPFRKDGSQPESFGFPMSDHLRRRHFSLGRNARILASQSVERIAGKFTMPNISLHWRAIFQQILIDKLNDKELICDLKVGPVARKCENFGQYCRKCLEKLNLHLELTDQEIGDYQRNFESYRRKMDIFFQFRCLFAPIIESIVLLDKLYYLIEQMPTIRKASIVQIFEPEKSPRCYAIVAHK